VKQIKKIAVIGNGGGGKTTLSRRFNELYKLPLTHVDSIQFIAGLKTRNVEETRTLLNQIADTEAWIIDGFGPLDVMERRFAIADRVVFVDFPLWRHYWWCTKRQIQSYWQPRSELPEGCDEASLAYTFRLYKTLWRVHMVIRPKLLEIFNRAEVRERVVRVKTLSDWRQAFSGHFPVF